jgi:hypothetical protein
VQFEKLSRSNELKEAAGREGKLLWLRDFLTKCGLRDSQSEKKMIQDKDGAAALPA